MVESNMKWHSRSKYASLYMSIQQIPIFSAAVLWVKTIHLRCPSHLLAFLRERWSCRISLKRRETMQRIMWRNMCTTWGTNCTAPWRSSWTKLWVQSTLEAYRCAVWHITTRLSSVTSNCFSPLVQYAGSWLVLIKTGGHRELAVWRWRGPTETSLHR